MGPRENKARQINIALIGKNKTAADFKNVLDPASSLNPMDSTINLKVDGSPLMIWNTNGMEITKQDQKKLKEVDVFIYIDKVTENVIEEIKSLSKKTSIHTDNYSAKKEPWDCVKNAVAQINKVEQLSNKARLKSDKTDKKQASDKGKEKGNKEQDQIKIAVFGDDKSVSDFKIGLDPELGKKLDTTMKLNIRETPLMILDAGGLGIREEHRETLKEVDAVIYIDMNKILPSVVREVENLRKNESIHVYYHSNLKEMKPLDCVNNIIAEVKQAKQEKNNMQPPRASGKAKEEFSKNLQTEGFFNKNKKASGKVKEEKNKKDENKKEEGYWNLTRK